jgi:hypothetical protein
MDRLRTSSGHTLDLVLGVRWRRIAVLLLAGSFQGAMSFAQELSRSIPDKPESPPSFEVVSIRAHEPGRRLNGMNSQQTDSGG